MDAPQLPCPPLSGWTIDTLRIHFEELIAEKDRRYDERFEAQRAALNAALEAQQAAIAAQKETLSTAFLAALTAAEKAVTKAETAAEKRFEAVNEFRGQLSDQATMLMPRLEADTANRSMREKIDALTTRLEAIGVRIERGEGKAAGMSNLWGLIVGGFGMLGVLGSIIVIALRR